MTSHSLVECDGCGKREEERDTQDWLKTKIKVRQETYDVDFDSYECMAKYATRHAESRE